MVVGAKKLTTTITSITAFIAVLAIPATADSPADPMEAKASKEDMLAEASMEAVGQWEAFMVEAALRMAEVAAARMAEVAAVTAETEL